MSWRDELRRVTLPDGRLLVGASFRGVPFFVERAERTGGRRIVTHEFPLRDAPAIDDLGRRARTFPVEGYVLGDDYKSRSDALIAALEDVAGPGELIHPYHGTRRVMCSSLTVSESTADGGMARLSLQFNEEPTAPTAPVQVPQLASRVADAADAVDDAIRLELESSYVTAGVPGYALESAADDLRDLGVDLGARLRAEVRDAQELARLAAAIEKVVDTASALIRSPGDAITAIRALLALIEATVASAPRRIFVALMATYAAVELVLVEGETDSAELERSNQQALGSGMRQSLLVAAGIVLLDVVHASVDDAVANRSLLVAAIDEQALTAGDFAYPALMQLRAAVLLAVPGDAALARVVTVERSSSLPAMALSYQLYGHLGHEQDLVDRNVAQHPGFLVGDLKVLSNG